MYYSILPKRESDLIYSREVKTLGFTPVLILALHLRYLPLSETTNDIGGVKQVMEYCIVIRNRRIVKLAKHEGLISSQETKDILFAVITNSLWQDIIN